jgi:4-alpha-glucanotransferase
VPPVTDLEVLRDRARELAIETFYWDNEGRRHDANPEALRRVVEVVEADYTRSAGRRTHPIVLGSPERVYGGGATDAHLVLADGTEAALHIDGDEVVLGDALPLGSHHLALSAPDFEESVTIVVAPEHMPRSAALAGGTAVFAPAYALWEEDSRLPSFGNLASLCRSLPPLGVEALVTLPLYAGFFDEPFDPSPYAPVSRLHWNEVYLDDDSLPPAPEPEIGDVIDWQVLARRRRRQLLDAATRLDEDPVLAARVARWAEQNPDVAAYARFRATVAREPGDAGFPDAVVDASHRLAQLLAHEQLTAIETPGPTSSTAAFALDLPIGSHPAGYETWAHPDLWAPAMAVGAPPDALFAEGQNWGFPPQLPGEAERTGFALWRRLVAQCGRYASMLRIDHVLGLHRLWWVPDGMSPKDGVYVRYPRQTLTSVIAAEAALTNTTVVGEDLGTVPQEILDLLADWDLLGLYAEQLELAEDLRPIPAGTVAGLRTHDMPAFAALYEAGELGEYREQLAAELGRPVADSARDVLEAALTRLARSNAYLVIADIDDLIGETRPHNVPGQVLPGTWRRRFAAPASQTLADPRVRHALSIVTDRGRR